MVPIVRSSPTDPFVPLPSGAADLAALEAMRLLPVYRAGDEKVALAEDLAAARTIGVEAGYGERLFAVDAGARQAELADRPSRMILDDHTYLNVVGNRDSDVALGPALANLQAAVSESSGTQRTISYLEPCSLVSADPMLLAIAERQVSRSRRVSAVRAAELANSAYYMGSKRSLTSFVVEAMSTVLGPDGTAVDLMCGSGAVAGALAHEWPTYASDAQQFARTLAHAQGAGFSVTEADEILKRLEAPVRANAEALNAQVGDFIAEEEQALHRGDRDIAVEAQRSLFRRFPTLAHPANHHAWQPQKEIEARRTHSGAPGCLFTCYYANLFFGIRQSVEIDSLRVGIETLSDEHRAWALAALIASVSAVATNYGGHFAQPLIRDEHSVTSANIGRITELRALSVSHEFAARLRSFAAESEVTPYPVRVVDGPWERALARLSQMIDGRVAVYVDPPYRREEYSRYYHVLETLVRYDYPVTSGPAQIPEKGASRFGSPFFTRSLEKRHALLISLIQAVLAKGWSCAWSYSESAHGSIPEVVRSIVNRSGCSVRSFTADHRHRGHGRGRDRVVDERLIVFEPR